MHGLRADGEPVDSDDNYWNSGDGWAPIGEASAPFTADFNGNRRTVSNLFIDRDTEDAVGLFGAVDSSRISGVTLAGTNVSGRHAVGSLLGDGVYGSVVDNHVTGQVSGQDEVGGLVGRTWGTVWYSSAAVNVAGNDAVGGLLGHQILNDTIASYATGSVKGMDAVGGLAGAVSDVFHVIEASYATGNVSGRGSRLTDSDSGFIICDLVGALSLTGPVETTTSTGGGVGGLVGSSCGWIQVSYAMRYDRDGNGYAGTVAAYAAAFPSPLDRFGCGVEGCSGYELLADLDFDTDGDGAVDSDDDYWNDGDGWEPIGWDSTYECARFFNATFDGNEHTLSNLFTTGRGFSGLFGRIGLGGIVDDLTLADVNVTGTEAAGALVGENQGLLSGIQSSGQVSGELHVGGLVGLNLRLVILSRSSAAVTGMRPPLPPGTGIVVTFGPPAATGGLVGYNTGFVVSSYATGPVTSDRSAGGLVGYHQSKLIAGSYATGPVAGSSAGGLVGTVGTPFEEATIKASYATGGVDRGTSGGLVGYNYDEGVITASYATGRVPDGRYAEGLVGNNDGGTVTSSYWDTRTSGQACGSSGTARTTSQLQSPTSYSGIYGSWNVDIDEDNTKR